VKARREKYTGGLESERRAFLLGVRPSWGRLYPGFKYEGDVSRDRPSGALQAIEDFKPNRRAV